MRLLVILDALNTHSKIKSHIDESCEQSKQKGVALKDTAVTVKDFAIVTIVKSNFMEQTGKGAGVNGQRATTVREGVERTAH